MKRMLLWLAGPALLGPLFAAAPPGMLNYQAYCRTADGTTVSGYVLNASPNTYQVSGIVKFTFSNDRGIAHNEIEAAANAFIAPGQTVLVASSPLPYALEKDETCGFDVSAAISGMRRLKGSTP